MFLKNQATEFLHLNISGSISFSQGHSSKFQIAAPRFSSMRKICVVIGSRANYSSIKSLLSAVQEHESLQLQIVVAASALLDRYGAVVDLIEADGFKPDAKVHMLIEGETPTTMAKSTGLGLIELPSVLKDWLDMVVTVGDRFETMATTLGNT